MTRLIPTKFCGGKSTKLSVKTRLLFRSDGWIDDKTKQNEETTWRSESTFALIIDIGGCAVVSFLDRGDGNRSSQNIWMDCRWADRIVYEPSAYYYVWKPSRATNEIPWSIVLLLRPLCHLPHLPGILRLAFERGMLVRLPPGKSPGGIPTKIRLGGRKLRRRRQAQNQNQSQRVHRQFPARVHVQLLRRNPGFRGMHERETQILRRSIVGIMEDWNHEKKTNIFWSTNPIRGRTIEDSSLHLLSVMYERVLHSY